MRVKKTTALTALLFAFGSQMPSAGTANAQSLDFGKTLFQQNCAACHGPEGAGDGPVADFLEPHPANLTKLADDNDGVFPFKRVWNSIATGSYAAHGTSEMPVWGTIFMKEALPKEVHPGISAEALVESRMLALTYYLQSVQR